MRPRSPPRSRCAAGSHRPGRRRCSPASALAAPTPMKSRFTSGPSALSEKARVVAAVCTITTSAMSTASGATMRNSSQEIIGSDGRGAAPPRDPSVATPRASRPSAIVADSARQRPISAPGKRGLKRSPASMIASTPKPKTNVQRLAACARAMRDRACCTSGPSSVLRPAPTAPENQDVASDADKEAGRHRNGQ